VQPQIFSVDDASPDCNAEKSRFVTTMCGRFTYGDPNKVNEACFLDFSIQWPERNGPEVLAPIEAVDQR
jgi:hypothetical protein